MAAASVSSSLSASARTGDLLLFNQRCDALIHWAPLAAACLYRKYGLSHRGGGVVDHVGVVVRHQVTAVPWVVESRLGRVRCTPLDQRLLHAPKDSLEVTLMRLKMERTPATESAATAFLEALRTELFHQDRGQSQSDAVAALSLRCDKETAAVARDGRGVSAQGVGIVLALYVAVGLLDVGDVQRHGWSADGLRSASFRRCLGARGGSFGQSIHVLQLPT